jgi:Flp pilus assembly protein TadB
VIVLAAALAGLAVWLLVRPAVDGRLGPGGWGPERLVQPETGAAPTPAGGLPTWTIRGASALAALSAWWLLGGVVGIVAAAVVLLLVPRLLGRMESRAERVRRTALDRQAPLLADLLAATLATGATFRASLGAVAKAIGEPTAGALGPALVAMDLGADPVEAWRSCGGTGAHALVIDAVARSAESGAPVSRVLARLADDLRREHRVVVEVAARSAGVRAVAPLAACFLPAFVLLGVVPVVASLAGAVLS